MTKRNKIIYWVSTLWLALGMFSSGLVQLLKLKTETDFMADLGYPAYFCTIIGFWKLLGVLAILAPKYPLIKEWAYAGFFICMSGALASHIFSGDSFSEMLPSILLLTLTVVSWYFRPESRKFASVNPSMNS